MTTTLALQSKRTVPPHLTVAVVDTPGVPEVRIGEYEITMRDFLRAAHHVLTATPLKENDPRMQFLTCMKLMIPTSEDGGNMARLSSLRPPV